VHGIHREVDEPSYFWRQVAGAGKYSTNGYRRERPVGQKWLQLPGLDGGRCDDQGQARDAKSRDGAIAHGKNIVCFHPGLEHDMFLPITQ